MIRVLCPSDLTPTSAGVVEVSRHMVRPWCGLCGWSGSDYSVDADLLNALRAQWAAGEHSRECAGRMVLAA